MSNVAKQQDSAKELIKLIKENPELPIFPLVSFEACGDDSFNYWGAAWGAVTIDEYVIRDERIYFHSEDEERLVDEVWDDTEKHPDITREEAKKIVDSYEWQKAIVVYIEAP